MTTYTKRMTKKKVWDWHELIEAVSSSRRLNKQTEISDLALKKATTRYHRDCQFIAQLDERVIACATPEKIVLDYLCTERGQKLEESRLCSWVQVYPAAGGRTTYCIDDAVWGWFANAMLPINAGDRRTRSQYQSKQWHYGQSGVYQKGTGPYYPDVGPECANLSLDAATALVQAAEHISVQFREAACSVMQRVAAVVSPFRDTVVRYEPVGMAQTDGMRAQRMCIGGRVYRESSHDPCVEMESDHGVFIRLKSPAAGTDGGWALTADFVVAIIGPPAAYEDPPAFMYGAHLAYPQGRHNCVEAAPSKDISTGLPFTVSRSPVRIIEAARQWAANRLYIPCA